MMKLDVHFFYNLISRPTKDYTKNYIDIKLSLIRTNIFLPQLSIPFFLLSLLRDLCLLW